VTGLKVSRAFAVFDADSQTTLRARWRSETCSLVEFGVSFLFETKKRNKEVSKHVSARNREPLQAGKLDRCCNKSHVGKLRYKYSSRFNGDNRELVTAACGAKITDSSIAVLGFTVWPGDI